MKFPTGSIARELLHIPANYEINGMLYVGYPSVDYKPNAKMTGHRFPVSHTCFDNDYAVPDETHFQEEHAGNPFKSVNTK